MHNCTKWLVVFGLCFFAERGISKSEPSTEADTAKINKLVKQLGDSEFSKREAASKELDGIGERALPALQKALADTEDLELRQRAQKLVQSITKRVDKEMEAKGITTLVGKWIVKYSNAATRQYTFEQNGNLLMDDKVVGKVRRKNGALLMEFMFETKIERYTMCVDGRLLVEHWSPASEFPKDEIIVGIGVRQR